MFGMKFLFYMNELCLFTYIVRNSDGEARFEVGNVKLIESRGIKTKRPCTC